MRLVTVQCDRLPVYARSRVCVELVHCIHGWLDNEQIPVGSQGKHFVVLAGQHADLSNLDDEHRFIRDKSFYAGGKPARHVRGEKRC